MAKGLSSASNRPAKSGCRHRSTLNSANWTVLTNISTAISGSNQAIVPAVSNRFFRLIHP